MKLHQQMNGKGEVLADFSRKAAIVSSLLLSGCGAAPEVDERLPNVEQACRAPSIEPSDVPKSRHFRCGEVITERICLSDIDVPDRNMSSVNIGSSFALEVSSEPVSGSASVGPIDVYAYGYDTRKLADYPEIAARLPGYVETIEVFLNGTVPGGRPDRSASSVSSYLHDGDLDDGEIDPDARLLERGSEGAFEIRATKVSVEPAFIELRATAASCEDNTLLPRLCLVAQEYTSVDEEAPAAFFDSYAVTINGRGTSYQVVDAATGDVLAGLSPTGGRFNDFVIRISDPVIDENNPAGFLGRIIMVYNECLKDG